MINVEFHGYRDWARELNMNLIRHESNLWQMTATLKPDVSLYYGWSEIIPPKVYNDHLCLILHPSPLPKYRGGSPLQHQIMAGEKVSAVTILKVGEKLDAGDIYSQSALSLEGTLNDIFERMVEIGTQDTIKLLNQIAKGKAIPIPQVEERATYFKRRTPEMSELDLESKTAEEAYNFIRALADPYPNAYIICKDGKRLYLTGAKL